MSISNKDTIAEYKRLLAVYEAKDQDKYGHITEQYKYALKKLEGELQAMIALCKEDGLHDVADALEADEGTQEMVLRINVLKTRQPQRYTELLSYVVRISPTAKAAK